MLLFKVSCYVENNESIFDEVENETYTNREVILQFTRPIYLHTGGISGRNEYCCLYRNERSKEKIKQGKFFNPISFKEKYYVDNFDGHDVIYTDMKKIRFSMFVPQKIVFSVSNYENNFISVINDDGKLIYVVKKWIGSYKIYYKNGQIFSV